MLSVTYAERHLCCVTYAECQFMLRVTNKPFMVSVIMLNVFMLSVVAPC